MKELRQETKNDLSRALYGLWREAENENFSPIFPIIEAAFELLKKGKDFANFQEAMKEIKLEIETSTDSDFSDWVTE